MLSDIKPTILSCQNYLKDTKTERTPLESYLTKYLLIYICAEYEKEYRDIVHKKAIKSNDAEITAFIDKKIDVRSLKIADLKGNILKLFNEEYPKMFQDELNKIDVVSKYHNIIEARNSAAHGGVINMSFNEVITTYESAEDILRIFSNVINS